MFLLGFELPPLNEPAEWVPLIVFLLMIPVLTYARKRLDSMHASPSPKEREIAEGADRRLKIFSKIVMVIPFTLMTCIPAGLVCCLFYGAYYYLDYPRQGMSGIVGALLLAAIALSIMWLVVSLWIKFIRS